MEDVNSRLKVSHKKRATTNSYEYTVICFVNICCMCLISIYFLFKIFHYSQALFIQSFEKNILPILVYGGGNFFTEVITLPVSHEEKWPLGHFIKKKLYFFYSLNVIVFRRKMTPVIVLRESLFFFTLSTRRNNQRISFKSIMSEFVCLFYVFYHQQSKLLQL